MAASLSHLCRLCGADTKNIKRNAIFDGEGCVKKYANKITECLTLQVKEEDQLPKVMCGECSQKLDLLSDFRDTAYKTESAFLTMVADLEQIKDEPGVDDNPSIDFSPSSPEMDLEQLVIKEDEPPPPPPVVIEKRPVRQAAVKHYLHTSKEQVPAKKSKPPKKTVLKSTPPLKEIPKLKTQSVALVIGPAQGCQAAPLHSVDTTTTTTKEQPSTANAPTTCKLCKAVFLTAEETKQHVLQFGFGTKDEGCRFQASECSHCGAASLGARWLSRHVRSHFCTVCQLYFSNSHNMGRHRRRVHGIDWRNQRPEATLPSQQTQNQTEAQPTVH